MGQCVGHFFLGEYAMMFCHVCINCFVIFGGYELPWLSQSYLLEIMTPQVGEVITRWMLLPLGIIVLLAKLFFNVAICASQIYYSSF